MFTSLVGDGSASPLLLVELMSKASSAANNRDRNSWQTAPHDRCAYISGACADQVRLGCNSRLAAKPGLQADAPGRAKQDEARKSFSKETDIDLTGVEYMTACNFPSI